MKDGNDAIHGSIHGKTPAARLKIGMDALLKHDQTGRVHYTQGPRRMQIVRQRLIPPYPRNLDIYEDCSSAVTGLYYQAGLHDPNNLRFSGYGFTGTLAQNGRKLFRWERPRIGDLVFYGHGTFSHVTMVYSVSPGGAVRVWSHGSESNPVIHPMDYRSDRAEIRRYFKK